MIRDYHKFLYRSFIVTLLYFVNFILIIYFTPREILDFIYWFIFHYFFYPFYSLICWIFPLHIDGNYFSKFELLVYWKIIRREPGCSSFVTIWLFFLFFPSLNFIATIARFLMCYHWNDGNVSVQPVSGVLGPVVNGRRALLTAPRVVVKKIYRF